VAENVLSVPQFLNFGVPEILHVLRIRW